MNASSDNALTLRAPDEPEIANKKQSRNDGPFGMQHEETCDEVCRNV